MSGTISSAVPTTTTLALSVTCLTGFVRRAEPIGIVQRGTHRLIDINGRLIAVLRSNTVNLFGWEGQFVTVCGVDEGLIEGVRSLLVTQVFRANIPTTQPQPQQIDLRLLLLLLLTNPGLAQQLPQGLLFALLSQSGLLGFGLGGVGVPLQGFTGLGVSGLGTAGLGTFGAAQTGGLLAAQLGGLQSFGTQVI